MKNKFIAAVTLLIVGFLFGFIPQYQRARELEGGLSTARADLTRQQLTTKLCNARSQAEVAYFQAMLKNYGIASDYFNRFYAEAVAVQKQTDDENVKSSLANALSNRDQIDAGLGKADPAVVTPLKKVVDDLQNTAPR